MTDSRKDVLIMTPTYNEKNNVVRLVREIASLDIPCHILVVDDNSPDGTGETAESLKNEFPNLSVLHRAGKEGIGSAHLEGIRYAYSNGYKKLVTMDCDFTHPPSYISKFLAEAEEYGLVVGNRYLNITNLSDWPFSRRLLTKFVHLLTLIILGIPFDATNAFRCYNLETIDPKIFEPVRSKSYSFFFESLFWLWTSGVTAIEIPIHLPARILGESKMTGKDILSAFLMLGRMFGLRLRRLLSKRTAEKTKVPDEILNASAR